MSENSVAGPTRAAAGTVTTILVAISFSHLLNDTIQSLFPALYPLLKDSFHLSYTQIGLITLVFQMTASLLQPVVGLYTDRRPTPYSLPVGMSCSLIGLLLLSFAGSFAALLVAAALVGLGSAVFHPESSRVARMASGGRYGFAQSFFQVGGNVGSAIGPLAAAFIVIPGGQAIDRLVLAGGAARHLRAHQCRRLVQAPDRRASGRRGNRRRSRRTACRTAPSRSRSRCSWR